LHIGICLRIEGFGGVGFSHTTISVAKRFSARTMLA